MAGQSKQKVFRSSSSASRHNRTLRRHQLFGSSELLERSGESSCCVLYNKLSRCGLMNTKWNLNEEALFFEIRRVLLFLKKKSSPTRTHNLETRTTVDATAATSTRAPGELPDDDFSVQPTRESAKISSPNSEQSILFYFRA